MDLNNVPITWKIDKLNELLGKMQSDINYSFHVVTGDDKDNFISNTRNIINNAVLLFKQGRVNQLDYDIKNKAFIEWNKRLNECLQCFPEFKQDNEKTL